MTSTAAWNSTEGLPKQFIASMRVLFDILDEKGCGHVHLDDIETRWHEEGVKGLPGGVTEALRKVTPANGYLSFDRFVAGLKLALLTSSRQLPHKPSNGKSDNDTYGKVFRSTVSDPSHRQGRVQNVAPNTVAVQPNNTHGNAECRSQSKSIGKETSDAKSLERKKIYDQYHKKTVSGQYEKENHRPKVPSKPDKLSDKVNSAGQVPPKVPPRDKSKRIITELKNWQRRVNGDVQHINGRLSTTATDVKLVDSAINSNHKKKNDYENINAFHRSSEILTSTPSTPPPQRSATVKRRDSARRHTLANGVDYNMIKRMKQLEEEKGILLKGLEMVDKARDWYHKQVLQVEEKQKYVGKTTFNDQNLEATQERMNFQHARVTEVNNQLQTLIQSSERGFPLHMNLALGPIQKEKNSESSTKAIQEDNKRLSKDVKEKNEKITQLEQEKASLIRELFEARARNKSYDDTTFM